MPRRLRYTGILASLFDQRRLENGSMIARKSNFDLEAKPTT